MEPRLTKTELKYLMSVKFQVKESYTLGNKIIETMNEGEVFGDINGSFKMGGGNWLTKCEDGSIKVDNRYIIETVEKDILPVDATGIILADGTVKLRLFFQTGLKKYDWLNHIIVVAMGTVVDGEYKLDAYTLESSRVWNSKAYHEMPKLEHLYYVEVDVTDAMKAGKLPQGSYMIIPITGGTFVGDELNGSIECVGADWNVMNIKLPITSNISTRYLLHTNDDAYISLVTDGRVNLNLKGIQAKKKGISDPVNSYFKQHLMFETADERYAWMNNELCVATVQLGEGGKICYDAYKIVK